MEKFCKGIKVNFEIFQHPFHSSFQLTSRLQTEILQSYLKGTPLHAFFRIFSKVFGPTISKHPNEMSYQSPELLTIRMLVSRVLLHQIQSSQIYPPLNRINHCVSMKRSLMKIFGNSKKELKVLYDAGQEEAFTKCWTTFSRVSCSLLRNKRPSTFHPNFCLEELGSVFFMSLDFTALTQSISINS